MKKLLPKFFILIFLICTFLSFSASISHAAVADDDWVIDNEVTFTGKNAARSGLLLDWTLKDYKWSKVDPASENPLIPFWVTIRNIVYALFILFVIITAFILVTTRGRSLSAKRFLPRFIIVILLVTFSFSLLQFLYQITDGIQGFFLRAGTSAACPPDCISQRDLFFWSWNYQDFIGLRKIGEANNESAYVSLFLAKLSAMTYYVMIGILIVRKIILWFFIVVSPIFPLLLLYYPVRNTAKIWIGEFFRWLFYAPLFAIFLAGLVSLWRHSIPLGFVSGIGGNAVYPTAVNILLAGPSQKAAFTNSVNTVDTYALYLVAIIMLWVVIILPFILLQIFLDYLNNLSLRENPAWSQMMTMINKRFPPNPPPNSPIPPGPASTGLARALPFRGRFQMPQTTGLSREIPRAQVASVPASVPASVQTASLTRTHAEVLKMTNLSVPTMRDIARFESARLQNDTKQVQEISKIRENLEKISSPQTISSTVDREKYTEIRDSLIKERDAGNPMATSILKAAEAISKSSTAISSTASSETNTLKEVLRSIAKPEIVNSLQKEKYVELKERIEKESQKGNTLATSVLSAVNTASKQTTSVTDTSSIKEIVRQLANPSSVADAKSRQQVVSLKEQLVKEKESNLLAKEVLTTIEKVTSSVTKEEKEHQITLLKEKLLQDANKGDATATALLSLMREEDTTQDVTKLKEKLTKAKDTGDNLAGTLLTLLAEKEAEEKATSLTAVKTTALPTTNRIQQVSLDDYEAVKDMWVDNYQNLEVPQTLEGEQSRKDWIDEDMAQIEDTINLLTSQDQEKIDKGMEEVSNILPFLLIGGFSQDEITAYLKAKLEAGKVALKIVAATEDKDDTLLEVRKASNDTTKTMTTSTHASIPLPAQHEVSSSAGSDDSDISEVQSPKSTQPNITINIISGEANEKILSLANLSIPKMLEVAKYEASLKNGNLSDETARTLLETMQNIANPGKITDPKKRQEVLSLRDILIKESKNQNPLAESILKASGVVDKENADATDEDMTRLVTLLKNLFDPTLVANATDREKYIDLRKKIEEKTSEGEILATAIQQIIKSMTTDYIFNVHALFEELKNPDQVSSQSRKEKIKKVKNTLVQEEKTGNITAVELLKTISSNVTMDQIIATKKMLLEEKEKGSTLSSDILGLFPSTPAIDIASVQNIKKLIDQDGKNQNPLALHIQTFLLKKGDIADDNIPLPESNKLQAVSLDDYEAVKKLWIDTYQNAQGNEEEKKAQLEKDELSINEAINLLSSPVKAKIEQGMTKVASILPFLLIGGFSQAEVVSYLKAKLEAARIVKDDELKKEDDEELLAKPQVEKNTKTNAEQAHLEEEKS